MNYKITIRGKEYFFPSLYSAKLTAEEIFQKTGVIVGIEEVRQQAVRSRLEG